VRAAGSPDSHVRGPTPVFRRASEPFPSRQGALPLRVGLARGEHRPETPSIGFISSLATRADKSAPRRVLKRVRLVSHRFACRDVARLVTDLGYRFTLPRAKKTAFRRASPRTGEDACHRLLQLRFTTRAPARTLDSRGERGACAPPSRRMEPKPQRTTRVTPRLTARLLASASSTTLPSSSDGGAGAVRSW
jgi:hypothetical protein